MLYHTKQLPQEKSMNNQKSWFTLKENLKYSEQRASSINNKIPFSLKY